MKLKTKVTRVRCPKSSSRQQKFEETSKLDISGSFLHRTMSRCSLGLACSNSSIAWVWEVCEEIIWLLFTSSFILSYSDLDCSFRVTISWFNVNPASMTFQGVTYWLNVRCGCPRLWATRPHSSSQVNLRWLYCTLGLLDMTSSQYTHTRENQGNLIKSSTSCVSLEFRSENAFVHRLSYRDTKSNNFASSSEYTRRGIWPRGL